MASKAQNDEIIDPNGLDLFRLTMMVITASICGGIFSLAGDMAAGGANTGAVIVSWGICFIGVFALMMVFNGLSQARPDLTGGSMHTLRPVLAITLDSTPPGATGSAHVFPT